ncbi:hypothetical protein ARAM_003644 [Aspergillus rambellii]|uniref:DUF4484 domain-containing protein n=1 Tax=Aspergillus rambellii TaxID=308745 RepID=A0A0F8V5A4_9EURO|nr:hypothetical protein ARAM_003644 [Aspergillus rambellii]
MDPASLRKKPLGLDVPRIVGNESPPAIAALFVIHFDIKAGYVVTWKRSIPGVEVEGAVEYKSLPSGLHNVSEDLVYFVHEEYAGISAFINCPAEEAERNAKMFAVGVLVPLSSGRLGKSWRHAPKLKDLALQYSEDVSNMRLLSEYWDTYELSANDVSAVPPDSPLESPLSLRLRAHGDRPDASHRNRVFSDAIVLETPRPALTPFHPASSLPDFLDTFGPLLFPLYRAALLRKRVLLMAEAPVHAPCNYVYDLSLLASLPNSLLPLLPLEGLPSLRPRPLFNVGVYDIPYLSSFVGASPNSEPDCAWIACSTDSVLSMKSELFDVLVTLPPSHSKDAAEKVYPTVSFFTPSPQKKTPQATELKATQRDVRRYKTLRKALRHIFRNEDTQSNNDDNSDAESTFSSSPIVEPLSWTRLAYTSFIWWASAGEKRDGFSEEEEEEHQIEQDARLLASVESLPSLPSSSVRQRSIQAMETPKQPPEVALVAYFRQLTTDIFITLSDVIARHDSQNGEDPNNGVSTPYDDDDDGDNATNNGLESDDDDNDDEALIGPAAGEDESTSPLLGPRPQTANQDTERGPVTVSTEDMVEMGLDVWSPADRIFVEELVLLWWGRTAYVDSARIRCCGISII